MTKEAARRKPPGFSPCGKARFPTTLGQAVEEGLRRIRRVWPEPSGRWTPDLLAEYRRVLTTCGRSELVEAVVTQAIDQHTEPFAPVPGLVLRIARERANRTESPSPSQSGVRCVEAAPDPRDPPGTVRYIAVQPDGRRIPPGARSVDEMTAA